MAYTPAQLFERREYARAINAFSARYRLGRPHVRSLDAVLNLRRFVDESRIAQRILGVWPPNIGRIPFVQATSYLLHPSIYLDNPNLGGADGRARHVKELRAYRLKQRGGGGALGGTTSPAGVQFIADFEGFIPTWYQDAVGVQTIGYGHTAKLPPGFSAPLSRSEGLRLLAWDLKNEYEPPVRNGVKVALQPRQFDALVSFGYNLGTGPGGLADLLPLVNRKDFNGAADLLLEYNRAGGQVLAGLVRRRQAEAAMLRP